MMQDKEIPIVILLGGGNRVSIFLLLMSSCTNAMVANCVYTAYPCVGK